MVQIPQMSIFDIEHHEGDVLIVVVEFLGFVAEFSLDLDDAVEGLVGDHRLEPDVQLQKSSGVCFIQADMVEPRPRTRLGHVREHRAVELKSLKAEPA